MKWLSVTKKEDPSQISRDDTKRRIVIGLNVRGCNVQSVVTDIQKKLENGLKLPPGYYITYGGQFENLVEAKKRLSIAVPIALALIFVLLFFTFGSFKETMMIFTAIPLAVIGGIFALLIRGMPFSISAGVGFIALFGVAVLNGIVLISYFNQLEKEGITDLRERILTGVKVRLRPVIMTAAVASLGFLPMTISTSAGAEVQRPLATVVIGGLITSTLLTLIVLPVLYSIFISRFRKKKAKLSSNALTVILLSTGLSLPMFGKAQTNQAQHNQPLVLSVEDAVKIATDNNPVIKSVNYSVTQQEV
ncbi:MAG TPA: efflux RND transporter permease subunit, partial [Bacteroidales bacterium]